MEMAFTAATVLDGSQPNFARCLAVSWAATLKGEINLLFEIFSCNFHVHHSNSTAL